MKNHSLMKRVNECRILNALRVGPQISRSQIAEATNLDKKTVTNAVVRLIDQGLIFEPGSKVRTEGRPHELLDFDPQELCVGLSIEPDHATGVLTDLRGNPKVSLTSKFKYGVGGGEVIRIACEVVESLLGQSARPVHGIGVAIPAVIDPEGRIVRASNFKGMEGLSLEKLGLPAGIPAWLENSSKAKALAEKWFGAAADINDFVSINLGIGIGAGIIIQRRLYNGSGFFAGEIGHTIIFEGGKRCSCGKRGCLEAYLSENTILKELSLICSLPITKIEEAPKSPEARSAFRGMGYLLGKALAPVVNVLNPSRIFVNGALARFSPSFMEGTTRGVKDYSLPECAGKTEIVASLLPNAAELGAASLVLSSVFEIPDQFYV